MTSNGIYIDRLERIEDSLTEVKVSVDENLENINTSMEKLSSSIDKFREVLATLITIHETSVPIKLVYYMFGILIFAFGGGAAVGAFKHFYSIP